MINLLSKHIWKNWKFSISVIMMVPPEMNSTLPVSNISFTRITSNAVGSIFPTTFFMVRCWKGASGCDQYKSTLLKANLWVQLCLLSPLLETICFARVVNQGVPIYCKQPLLRKFSITLTRISWWPMWHISFFFFNVSRDYGCYSGTRRRAQALQRLTDSRTPSPVFPGFWS